MAKHDLQERLINGFSRYGYELYADDNMGMNNEFRKAGATLVFTVKPGEGGIYLLWTENGAHDLRTPTPYDLITKLPPDVECRTFYKGPKEFWQAVEDIIGGR